MKNEIKKEDLILITNKQELEDEYHDFLLD